jgi:hypothetical protein
VGHRDFLQKKWIINQIKRNQGMMVLKMRRDSVGSGKSQLYTGGDGNCVEGTQDYGRDDATTCDWKE